MSYFKTAHWEEEWITTAERLVRTEFARSYMNIEADEDVDIVETTPDNDMDTKVCRLIISLQLTDSITY